jgi:TatD DNase family protein
MEHTMIIDTHIHLYDDVYTDKLDEVIREAIDNDIGKMIVVGFDKESSYKAVQMANDYEFIYAAVGVHPTEVKKISDFSWINELAKDPRVVAIGEIGLDYYWDSSYKELQKTQFIKQIEIARNLNLPIIVHSREAQEDTYDILKENQTLGVLHCYAYDVSLAKKFVSMGYYLGIGGVVTFKNSKNIKEVVKEIDLEFLVSETDGPYLAPSPFRGKVNQPKYLINIVEEIANLKEKDLEFVKDKLARNANKLFNL